MFVGLYIGDVICIEDENPRSKLVNETPEHLSPADVQLDPENRADNQNDGRLPSISAALFIHEREGSHVRMEWFTYSSKA